jgi:hypothetical protein
MAQKMMLSGVRCSFLVLAEPEDYQGNKKYRWSATALFPKDGPIHKAVLAAMLATAEEKWPKGAQKILDAALADSKGSCLLDGKFKDYDGYEGQMALTAHRYQDKGRPLVLDKDKSPIYRADNNLYEGKGGILYSGAIVNMQVEFWAQDNANGKALRATLVGIQKVRDADAFGGGTAPKADDFAEVAEGADADDLV